MPLCEAHDKPGSANGKAFVRGGVVRLAAIRDARLELAVMHRVAAIPPGV
jgi:hypothetical protein